MRWRLPERRPRVLAVLPALFPSTIIGVAKPLLRLHQDQCIELDLTLQHLVSKRTVERADVLVMCHTIAPEYGDILVWARDLGRPLIYEIDDDLLDVPAHLEGLAYLREPRRRAQLVACLRQADQVRVYSPGLQQKLSQYNGNVRLVSGPLDWSLLPFDSKVSASPSPSRSGFSTARDTSRVKIVYATSRLEDSIGAMLVAPLQEVLDRHDNVELTIWGPRHDALAGHPRVRSLPLIRDYDRFFQRFAREQFSIGLAPLPDDEFHRGKSNNKFREYASCGIAGVYSDMSVYNTSVVHEVTGLLVGNDVASWVTAIERLILDAELRAAIGERARRYAHTHFNEQVTDGEWWSTIRELAARPRAVPAAAAPAGRPAADKALGVARLAGRLATKVVPVLREHGIATALRRTWVHLVGFTHWLSWELHLWRLQQRVSAHRGRS
jgi:glycosyltransferase involved in cell wall biosynthesis